MSSIRSLSIATQALLAHRAAIDVISNNIANVNTPGYTRRVSLLAATSVEDVRYGSMGTGVTLSAISAQRASFLAGRFRAEQAAAGEFDVRSGFLSRIEAATGEPGDSGITAALDAFFAGWSELANDPTDTGLKQDLVSKGEQLARVIRGLHESLQSERKSADEEIQLKVTEINRFTAEVASLNGRIREAELAGREALDLRDQRNLILDQLAALAPVRASEGEDGQVAITLAGRTLVNATLQRDLETRPAIDGDLVLSSLYVKGQNGSLVVEGGALGALQTLRDDTVAGYQQTLDRLASQVIEGVNAIHRRGVQGLDFFSGSGASDIAVQGVLVQDPGRVDTSSGSGTDNDVALELAALGDTGLAALDGRRFADFYRDLVVTIGGDAGAAEFTLEARQAALAQVTAQREEIEAVSLDEEMANMIAAEHAYEAAARVVSTVTEMLDTLLSIG